MGHPAPANLAACLYTAGWNIRAAGSSGGISPYHLDHNPVDLAVMGAAFLPMPFAIDDHGAAVRSPCHGDRAPIPGFAPSPETVSAHLCPHRDLG